MTVPLSVVAPPTYAPAAEGEEVINGLVVRSYAGGGYLLVDAETGSPVIEPRHRRVSGWETRADDVLPTGVHLTEGDAAEWARNTYPHALRLAQRIHPRHSTKGIERRCARCSSKLVPTGTGSYACPTCPGVEHDYS